MAKFVRLMTAKGEHWINLDQVLYVRERGLSECYVVLVNGHEFIAHCTAATMAAMLNSTEPRDTKGER